MIATDENALICDFAEIYHIYDFRLLPVKRAAIFASGLRENSRIRMKMSGMNYPLEEILLASIADRMAFIAWTKTKDAENNVGRPESILAKMLNKNSKAEDIVVFNSGEDFREARKRIIDGRE